MANGTFIFIRDNKVVNLSRVSHGAGHYSAPDLNDAYCDDVQLSERIFFLRDNGQVWLMKDRLGQQTVPVPCCLLDHISAGFMPLIVSDIVLNEADYKAKEWRRANALAMARAHSTNGYRSYAIPMAIQDVKVALAEADAQKKRADEAEFLIVGARGQIEAAQAKLKDDGKDAEIARLTTQLDKANVRIRNLLDGIGAKNGTIAEFEKKLAQMERLLDNSRITNRALNEATTKNIADARPLRPEFVDVISKRLDNLYETHGRGAIICDVRSLVTTIKEITREVPVVAPPASLPEPKLPPRKGDVWSFSGWEREIVGRCRCIDETCWKTCDPITGINESHTSERTLRDGRATFVRRARPKLSIKVDNGNLSLDRGDDTRTQYNAMTLLALVCQLRRDHLLEPITNTRLLIIQTEVDRWVNKQIVSGALYYNLDSDRWMSKP